MNGHDTLTVVRSRLTEVRDSLGDVHMTTPVAEIVSKGRRRRMRRGLSAVAAACAAVGLAVALALPSGSEARQVHVHLAAWSVDTSSDGTVTVTVRDMARAALLERVLAEAGVPAVVTPNRLCLNRQNQNALGRSGALRSGRTGVVIHPSAIPSGTKILFSVFYTHGKLAGFGWGLVKAGAPLHCHIVTGVHAFFPAP
jgi:hypothetical protein